MSTTRCYTSGLFFIQAPPVPVGGLRSWYPIRLEAVWFSVDTALYSLVLFEYVERHLAQEGQILARMVLAHPTVIFRMGHVQHPVQSILNTSVCPNRSLKYRCIVRR